MRFVLSGIEKDGTESSLSVRIDQVYSYLQLNNGIEKTLKRKDFLDYLTEYVSGYYLHIEYEDRKFCKLFNGELNSEVRKSLVRTFAISSAFLDKLSDSVIAHEDYILETLDKYFVAQLMTDWTANQFIGETQPQLFFIKNVMEEEKGPELKKLYYLGLLQKYTFQGQRDFSNYYLPALRPDDNSISQMKPPVIWNEIVKEMNTAIKRFAGGFKKYA